MVIAPVLWSTAGVVTRHVERASAFDADAVATGHYAGFVALAMLLQKNSVRLGKAVWLSGAMWAVMFTAFMLALQLTSTANTLRVMSVSPLLTALLARAFLSEPIAIRTWLAVSAAAVGIAWMFASGLGAHSARDYLGMAIAAMVPVAAAINVVTLRASSASVDLRPAVMLGGALSWGIAAPLAFPLQATGRDVALLGALGQIAMGLVFFPLFDSGVFLLALLACLLASVALSAQYGPLPALLAEQFPAGLRSTGLSLAYNFAVTLFGGFAALIVTLLIEETGSKLAPSFYVIAAAVVSALTLLAMRDRTGQPIG